MPKPQKISDQYLMTEDAQLSEAALLEGMQAKEKWKRFLEDISSITKLTTGPLFAVGGAALLAAAATNPVVPLALGIGLLVVATLSLVTAVASSHALESINKADDVRMIDAKAKTHAKQMVQEIKNNGLCIVPENELVKLSEGAKDKGWTQRIQTAELNEAAQRSIH